MKNFFTLSTLLSTLLVAGCGERNAPSDNELVTIDATKSYPEKTFVLQDLFDVEYVPLETTDDFLTYGAIQAVGEEYILSTNMGNDGDILLFDRKTGRGAHKINRLGQGGEEYAQAASVVLDEVNREVFVVDPMTQKIRAYDYEGNFKRDFAFPDEGFYTETLDYDRDHLLCFLGQMPNVEGERSAHVLVAKRDGRIAQTIALPYESLKTPVYIDGELSVTPAMNLTAPFGEAWAVTRTSSDTIYRLSDGQASPLIVRQPSIQTMDQPEVFLYPYLLTDQYYFLQTQEKSLNLQTFKGFPTTDLVYDTRERTVYRYELRDATFQDHSVSLSAKPNQALNGEVAAFQALQADVLLEANAAGKLSGPLKTIAEALDEEDNPVILIARYKR